MGKHEGSAHPSGLIPNGLLPDEGASVIQVLDSNRWTKAEERTAELIACIQPNQPSEERRNAVANYVQRLIMKCFPCQVFTFGSVPLKTYLPDGDIDLTAFSNNQILSDTWANQVRDMLKDEEKNESAEFRVKEVQYIQAEVKIIKCLVENIVVDISFNQLGGLCTLCFLEEVDNLIKPNHLFKRSIILIKAWCYYESRILGAHHGLISTYALETLVLYIFHVFNNSFAGPLEVLYRFLEFFSKFDWDSFCVSLWGPVPISSLPDVAAEPPRKDDGEMRLSKLVYDCSSMYAVSPGGQDNHGQPFISKHFNVIDPLRTNNNLGRSVSKGNFYRIRSAFSFGAKRLARVLDCPKDNVFYEVNQFFVNTWERHGSGHRPDAPSADILRMTVSHPNQLHGSENLRNSVVSKKINDFSGCQAEVGEPRCLHSSSSPHVSNSLESMSKAHAVSNVSRHQKKSYNNLNSSAVSDQKIKRPSNAIQVAHDDKGDKTSKPGILTSELQGRFIFSRTRSSPELTEAYSKVPFRGGRERAAESGKNQINSAKLDNSRRKNVTPQTLTNQNNRPSVVDSSSASHTLSPQSIDAAIKSNTASNSYHDESKLGVMGEDAISSVRMHHGDQETVNMMAPMVQGFNEQVHMPLNLAPAHLPLPISPTVLASMGYVQRNLPGIVQANVPLSEHPWAANMQFSQGVLSPSVAHYFPGVRFPSNPVDVKASNDKFGSVEMNGEVADSDFWHEQDRASTGGDDLDDESFEMFQAEYRQQVALSGHNFSSPTDGSGTSVGVQQRHSKDCMDGFQYQDRRGNEICLEERSVGSEFAAASHSSSVRSKTSSEGSWDGSSTKVLKSTTEKQGKRTTSSSMSSTYGKVKDMSEFEYSQVDSDHRDWNSPSILASEVAERSGGPQFVSSHDSRNQIGFEVPQESASDSLMPIAPMLIGPSSRSRALDNSGAVPFAFYPTGPPVPFLTMLPVYNFPSDPGTPDTLKRHFTEEETLDNSDSGQNFDSSDGINQSHVSITNSTRRDSLAEPNEELKSDILNSDFTSHWQNLQYGRFCQGPRYHGPFVYPSPIMVPPVCLQGRFPMDCPGRPISTNINLLTQLMNYDPRLFPVPSFQHVSHRPTGVHQRYVDEIPRYRSGTGTYLPNPVPVRDKHSSGSRKGSYDHVSDREGNWNISRTRVAGRSHNRSQPDRPGIERLAASEGRAERCWSLHKSDSLSTSQPQIGPFCSNVTQAGSANVAYGMYPVPPMNQDGVTSNGPTVPSVVMFYPIDQNANYGSPAEQLEFGSLGPVGFSSTSNASFPTEGNKSGGALEEHRRRSSISRSSLDQPSSNHSQRRL